MSAPDTNLEKQKRRHWGPLAGIAAAVVFAFVLFLGFVGWLFSDDAEPGNTVGGPVPSAEAPAGG